MKFLKTLVRLTKYLVLFVAVAYIFLTFLTIIFDFDVVVDTFFDLIGVNSEYFFSYEEQGSEELNDVLYDSIYYNVIYAVSLISAILGMLVLSRKRSFFEAIGLLLGFVIPRERKSWGRVFDSSSARPIPFATIYLRSRKNGAEISKVVADSDGRYKLLVPDKDLKYSILVKATGYKDHERKLDLSDAILGTGEYIEDIFIKKMGEEERGFFTRLNYILDQLYWYLVLFIFLMALFSFVSALYYLYAYPGSSFGMANIVLFGFAVIWNIFAIKGRLRPKIGRVMDVETKQPLSDVKVYVYKDTAQVRTYHTDETGVVYSVLEPGEYDVLLSKNGYEPASQDNFQQILLKEDGYFDSDLLMKRKGPNAESSMESNPFA